ncbi:uncharacterized protein LOC113313589 isoform X1 [Papaver somniferum]|uniref:uncharacterized protein LOC113313589 isoform X1 n=1 Tax=Papaver somniferum TaxID=3469 RepID=UPI000E6F9D58|nr:uncharacterized protein LOC113313589 isoform X1 [Papaver somniferum]
MRTRFLNVDYFSFSSEKTLINFFSIPVPKISNTLFDTKSQAEAENFCFDSVLDIDFEIEPFQIDKPLSLFLNEVLPHNIDDVPDRDVISSNSNSYFDEQRNSQSQDLNRFQQVSVEEKDKGNFKVIPFETPELDIVAVLKHGDDLVLPDRVLETEMTLDLSPVIPYPSTLSESTYLDLSPVIPYPCTLSESINLVEDITLDFQIDEKRSYVVEDVQDRNDPCTRNLPVQEVNDCELKVHSNLLESFGFQQRTVRDEQLLVSDGKLEHGTTIICMRQPTEVSMGGDSRRTCKHSISNCNTTKVHKIGKSVLYGDSGLCSLIDSIRIELTQFIASRELVDGRILLEDVAREASMIYCRTGSKEGYSAIIGGFEGNLTPGFIWRVNTSHYWRESNEWACIGSGRMYAEMYTSTFNPSLHKVLVDETFDKSMFTATVNDFCTGGMMTVASISETNDIQKVIYRTRTIAQLMDKYGIHFDEASWEWIQTTCSPRLKPIYLNGLGVSSSIRSCVMIGLRLDEAVLLFRDEGLRVGCHARYADGYQIMLIVNYLGLAGFGPDYLFSEIVNYIKLLIAEQKTDKKRRYLEFYASKIVSLLESHRFDRDTHPVYLVGGFDQPWQYLPSKSSLWCVTKAGCYPVDRWSHGCPYAEYTVATKFSSSLSTRDAEDVGYLALNNIYANCITIVVPQAANRKRKNSQVQQNFKKARISQKDVTKEQKTNISVARKWDTQNTGSTGNSNTVASAQGDMIEDAAVASVSQDTLLSKHHMKEDRSMSKHLLPPLHSDLKVHKPTQVKEKGVGHIHLKPLSKSDGTGDQANTAVAPGKSCCSPVSKSTETQSSYPVHERRLHIGNENTKVVNQRARASCSSDTRKKALPIAPESFRNDIQHNISGSQDHPSSLLQQKFKSSSLKCVNPRLPVSSIAPIRSNKSITSTKNDKSPSNILKRTPDNPCLKVSGPMISRKDPPHSNVPREIKSLSPRVGNPRVSINATSEIVHSFGLQKYGLSSPSLKRKNIEIQRFHIRLNVLLSHLMRAGNLPRLLKVIEILNQKVIEILFTESVCGE